MQTAEFIAAAGVDPYQLADELITARPQEVAALGEAFQSAATAMEECGGLTGIAGELADAGACFDGASPTDLMSELSAVQASLAASPAQLAAIGGPLCELAAELAYAQLIVGDVLAGMEQQCAAITADFAGKAASVPFDLEPLRQQLIAEGAFVVQAAYAQVAAHVDAHDAAAGALLAQLQASGYVMPPDVDAGITDEVTGPPPCTPGAATSIPEWWAGLPPHEQATIIQQQPGLIASLPGLPPAVYDLVNRRELADADIDLQEQTDEAVQVLVDEGAVQTAISLGWIGDPSELADLPVEQLLTLGNHSHEASAAVAALLAIRGAQQKVTGVQTSITPEEQDGQNRYLLDVEIDAYDGDGTAVIAIGEVDEADNVAVVVQGATNDLYSIEGQTDVAESLLEEMADNSDAGTTNAVIVWENYDNPSLVEVIDPGQAVDGAEVLIDDLASYDAAHGQATGDSAHTTVVAHSYGTVVTSYALQDGAAEYLDDVVVYGSPGMVVDGVADLGMDTEHVFAGMDDDDILLDVDALAKQRGFDPYGIDPAAAEFGATEVTTGGVDGHTDYFGYEDGEPNEALANAGAVAAGAYDQVKEAGD